MATSPPTSDQSIPAPVLDQERQRKAREYSRLRRRLGFLSTALSLILLLILIFTGVSHWFTGLFSWPAPPIAVVFFLVITVGFGLLTFPLSYYTGFILPHRYGLSRQKLGSWLADRGKGSIIGMILSSAAVAVVYLLLIYFPDYWWFITWGLMLIFSVITSILAPIIIIPMFYKMKPMAEGDLKTGLQELARKAGAKIQGIFILDLSAKVTSANAALMGIGRTRRIVISDTLIQQYPTPEIEVITAHEVGHHIDRDIFRMFLAQAIASLVILWLVGLIFKVTVGPLGFSGIADPAALPWLALIFGILSALVSPLQNYHTRYVESQADEYALRLTGDAQAFSNAMIRLANQNLAVADPPVWEERLFYDHPSIQRRVEHARKFREENKPDL